MAEIEAEQALVAANRELITRFEQKGPKCLAVYSLGDASCSALSLLPHSAALDARRPLEKLTPAAAMAAFQLPKRR